MRFTQKELNFPGQPEVKERKCCTLHHIELPAFNRSFNISQKQQT